MYTMRGNLQCGATKETGRHGWMGEEEPQPRMPSPSEQAVEEGSAGVPWGKSEVAERVREAQWVPVYKEFVWDQEGER